MVIEKIRYYLHIAIKSVALTVVKCIGQIQLLNNTLITLCGLKLHYTRVHIQHKSIPKIYNILQYRDFKNMYLLITKRTTEKEATNRIEGLVKVQCSLRKVH